MERTLGYVKENGKLTLPRWVRALELVPPLFQHATLRKSTRWVKDLHALCEDYMETWPANRQNGQGAALLGASGLGKTYAAAALANEIEHVWGRKEHVKIEWVSVPWAFNEFLDMKHFHMKEEFLAKKWAWYKADLLILDDLFRIPPGNSFAVTSEIIALYHYREEHLLPTVITGNSDLDIWEVAEKVFDAPFARRLRDHCAGRTLILGGS